MKLSVVVPVYKEEKNIIPFLQRTSPVLEKITKEHEIIFVLDPSPDNTEHVVMSASEINKRIKLIKMSRRFGQPAATIAGLNYATGERVVVIDVDLQDPPELIAKLNEKANEGFDVVYATRKTREGESFIKKIVANIGYKVINGLSDVQIPRNTGDFRLMSRKVVDEICNLNEKHGFLRGLVAFVGFNQTAVYYNRDARFAGEGNYNRYFGSLKIGLNGLIGFSAKPLNLMSAFGGITAGLSFLLGAWYAGIQLLSLGLVGEYISRIYDEVKNRPMYIVEKKVGFDDPA